MPSLSDFLFGTKSEIEQLPAMDPQQLSLLSQILGQAGGLGGLQGQTLQAMLSGSQPFIEQMQAPYLRQFYEQTVPGIAERFTGAGGQRSSAFQQALGGAGASLAEMLAGQRAQLGLGQQQFGMGALQNLQQMGLGAKPFGYMQTEGQPGFLQSLAPGIGAGLGMLAGGGMGAGLSGLGSILGGFFGGKKPVSAAPYGGYQGLGSQYGFGLPGFGQIR